MERFARKERNCRSNNSKARRKTSVEAQRGPGFGPGASRKGSLTLIKDRGPPERQGRQRSLTEPRRRFFAMEMPKFKAAI